MQEEYPGKFIVLEGSDGSGKGTQFKLLSERLRAVGYEVELFDFPRYDQPSSHFVKRYLNGDYGPASSINAYTASMFYALDRYEAAAEIRKALAAGKIVLSNRYAGSNMAHQGSKFADETEQRGFFVWADSLEFSLLGIPRPNLNIFLRVPADISFKLIGEKNKRSYTDKSHDQHEADIEHLRKTVATYDVLSKLFPKDFVAVECTENGQILSIPAINDLIWQQVQPLLPDTPPNKGQNVVVQLNTPPAPAEKAEQKPAAPEAKGTQPQIKLPRVSMLAVLKIETSPGISVESRSLWSDGKTEPEYYITPGIDAKLAKEYQDGMKRLIDLHKQLRKPLLNQPDMLKMTVPMAALGSAVISGDSSSLSGLAAELAASPLAEFRSIAKQIRTASRIQSGPTPKTQGVRIDSLFKPDELGNNLSTSIEPLNLLDFWPRSEFLLLADGIYPYTDLGREEISQNVELWSYERKENTLRTMLLDPTNQVLEQAKYRWDVISDSLTLAEALRTGLVNEPQTQALTPRYGYEVPEPVEEAGIENEFIECFDTSLQLFSHLQAAGKDAEAGYAVLLGHKLRWQFSVNGKELARQITPSAAPRASKDIIKAIKEKIMEVHPILGASLNQLSEVRVSQPDPSQPPKKKRSRHRQRKPRH